MGHNDRDFQRTSKPEKRKTNLLLPSQPGKYGEYALAYWENGLKAFPAVDKRPLVSGATGHRGEITLEKISAWIQDPSYNLAQVSLRAEGWVSLDVDNYDGKQGASQLERLESDLGVLPDTYSSTARGQFSKSRQYFYRVPDDTPRKSRVAKDIEVVQRCHRNAAVHPTFHRKTGEIYYWYLPDGSTATGLPRLEDFPLMPLPWLDFLARSRHPEGEFSSRELSQQDLTTWVEWLGEGEPSDAYRELASAIADEAHIGHDLLGYYLREIHDYRLNYSELGGMHALRTLHNRYLHTTNNPNPEREWDDWVRWVVGTDWSPTEPESKPALSSVINWARNLRTGGHDASK